MSQFLFPQRTIDVNWIQLEPVRDRYKSVYEWVNAPRADIGNQAASYWPSSRMIGSDMSSGILGLDAQEYPGWFEFPVSMLSSGTSGGYYICGITRDSAGNPLAAVTVRAFRTSDNLLMGSSVSGPTGEYNLVVPTNEAMFLVSYLAGSPDVTGASVNNVVGQTTRTI